MHTVVETNAFRRAAEDVGLSEEERIAIATLVSEDPMLGATIPGTGGARKFRYAPPHRGKRGGYRVITYFAAEDVPVFLLDMYSKGEKIDLTKAERNELARLLADIADDYRTYSMGRGRHIGEKRK
ncbi:type II toxin-antitoxin system RelE/ParE family toxin [Salinarimonas ramus]|uniref:Addiction module toxin RelE n=1 Tax=Salinarimonas ramus TaxID=690164 RepID=A0A917Q710_9HYPH|nr:type II toxin-antitoxin system RelE/ParE family toxin [Salinarimonas ramus]GGK32622.1 hypothetical protein GCM10011322_19160 [Salinarimonas ramus]